MTADLVSATSAPTPPASPSIARYDWCSVIIWTDYAFLELEFFFRGEGAAPQRRTIKCSVAKSFSSCIKMLIFQHVVFSTLFSSAFALLIFLTASLAFHYF